MITYIYSGYIYIVVTVIIWILSKILLCEIFHHVIISHKDIVSSDHYLIFVKDQGGSWFELNITKWPAKILKAIEESTQHSLKRHRLQNICSPRWSKNTFLKVLCIKRTKKMKLMSAHFRRLWMHSIFVSSGWSHNNYNQILHIKPHSNVKHYLQLLWNSKESDDHIKKMNCNWNRSELWYKNGLSFKNNFKVQIFFNENKVSLFVTCFHLSLFTFTYLSLWSFWIFLVMVDQQLKMT